MLRSIFFATGLFITLCGGSFLLVDKMILNVDTATDRQDSFRGLFTSTNAEQQSVFDPPDWAAFSMISVGSVTMLYALALPKKVAG